MPSQIQSLVFVYRKASPANPCLEEVSKERLERHPNDESSKGAYNI